MSLLDDAARVESLTVLSRFRTDFYACLPARADALFELTYALPCTDGPVKTLVDPSLAPERRRGHGALYGALNHGRLDVVRLRRTLSGLPLPRAADGRIMLALTASPFGAALGGFLLDRTSAPAVLVGCGALMILTVPPASL
ncbi:transposase [Streptomyces sp. NBC_01363]|nr:transposase [Streptomyces sp. NBC_01363]